MKRTVYDIRIVSGDDAGMYRMFGIDTKALAEILKSDFEAEYGDACEIVEREIESVDIMEVLE